MGQWERYDLVRLITLANTIDSQVQQAEAESDLEVQNEAKDDESWVIEKNQRHHVQGIANVED